MFRTIRALIIAVIVAVSLVGSASVASAAPGHGAPKAPPTRILDITWE